MTQQRIRPLAALILLLLGGAASALEVGVELHSGNINFPWDQDEPIASSVTVFPWDNIAVGGEAWIDESLGDDARLRVSYELDPVLRNSVMASVQFERGIARIEVGPRIGLFNSDAAPFSAGLSSAVRLQWPGVAYASLRSEGGIAIGVLASSADPQARSELSAGFYIPNAIVSAIIETKRFNELDSGGDVLTTDSLTRYALECDIFKKGAPYTLLCSLGYESRVKHYEATDSADGLGAVMIGATATVQTAHALSVSAGLNSGFYIFGLEELKGRGPASSSFMFSAVLGVSFDIDVVRERTTALREARAARDAAAAQQAAEENPAPETAPPTAPIEAEGE